MRDVVMSASGTSSDTRRFTSALELAALIEHAEATPTEITAELLAAIERENPKLNAYITVTADRALADAAGATSRAREGRRLSRMDGVPYSLKDLEPTKGIRTTMGSKFFEHDVPLRDSVVADRVRATGAVLLGKTNTPQFGYSDSNANLIGPRCLNPWDRTRTTGGSSSGAGAATAAGLGPLAQGSDGGGSIRIPAALCGVVGFKPSLGRVPDAPSACPWAAFACTGPLARTVRDAALFLQPMAGPDPRDPISIDNAPVDYVAACDGDLTGLKVAISADLGYAPVDPEVRRIFLHAARQFDQLGCDVDEQDPGWSDPGPFFKTFNAVVHATHKPHLDANPEWVEPGLREMIAEGEAVSAVEFQHTLIDRTSFYNQALDFFDDFDLLLTPTLPVAAWPGLDGDHEYPLEIDGRATPHLFDHLPFTFPFNMTGQPAISVPAGFTGSGLPVGLQIVGRWHADHTVFRAAAAYEEVRPWAHFRPPLDSAVQESDR